MFEKSLSLPLILALYFYSFTIDAQTLYQFYDQKGDPVDFSEVIKHSNNSDMVFFGELHNNPVAHWATLEIIQSLKNEEGQLYFGLEMFERDQQHVLNDLNESLISLSDLEKYTRTWPNYKTDYKPIIEAAINNNFKILGTNIPRQYASYVYKKGIDSLYRSGVNPSFIPNEGFEIDTNLVTYAALNEMAKSMGAGHGNNFFVSAQAIKDITMAETLLKYFKKGDRLLHLNGAYHSKNKEGIIWFVSREMPDINILSIQTIETDSPEEFQPQDDNIGDYYLFINSSITKSYE